MFCGSEAEVWIMKYVKEFLRRGTMAAWGGPVILAIIYLVLEKCGVVTTLTVSQVVLAIISMTIMAFIAAGISFIYKVEQLPLAIATIIQMAVLYLDYLLFYRLNGWVPNEGLITFTVIFVAVFVAVWLIVYFCAVRPSVRKLNDKLNAEK